MGLGAVLEPLVVLTLLFGGTYVNRNRGYKLRLRHLTTTRSKRTTHGRDVEDLPSSPGSFASDDPLIPASQPCSPSLLAVDHVAPWRERELRLWGFKTVVRTPNSRQFKDRWFARVLRKFPFLQEAFYWALIYWVYQLGRAFTALTLVSSTVDVARQHALQLIRFEQQLGIFWEVPIQRFFLSYPAAMHWINRIYSFIHIPGTILFLVWLYYHTTTRNRIFERAQGLEVTKINASPAGPRLYEARRRTMAMCNLLAFIVFTFWPCMPPRLLSDPDVPGAEGELARSFGFVDTVHSAKGESSVWTQNRFCNQYAAMPSLHFGYSLLVGLTVMTIPLPPHKKGKTTISLKGSRISIPIPSWRRATCMTVGFLYPFTILVAIVATANHFILDAVAGAMVCGLAWHGNDVLLNLLPLEDWFLFCLRTHFPEKDVVEHSEGQESAKLVAKGLVQ
ncbi:uncharacterized protein PV09_08345 [Verruconis gallopava]|uniref:Inositolphosphotransferase Aur1/Ipt1 domain-containing protein n=1 Tax=Verruconis gallopava TaxID=253628 RepID=A0A0D2A044_9PEZI|nr:uncharacterized protein PV09_08345 [Verruconis gallopava]KIV99987.1 hypothetical protein PV09_08345 [Verruconis gallopava]